MDNLEQTTLFVESNEIMGLLYNNYKHLPKTIDSFLDIIEDSIKLLLSNPYEVTIDLNEDISKFKKDIEINKTPEEIYTDEVEFHRKNLKKTRDSVNTMLNRLIKLKDRVSFGGNLIRSILKRPKVYSKEMSYEKYESVNNNIRNINRALDWVEKIIIDLYNLIDQDLNILTIINKVYIKKHIYENATAKSKDGEDLKDDTENKNNTKTTPNSTDNEKNTEGSQDNNIEESKDKSKEVEDKSEGDVKDKSLPKQVDSKESNKNGVKRKQLYIAFIEYAKSIHSNNLFGSVFDKDAFVLYSFVPQEMRYFYRLANPLLCVLNDSLTFFALSELKKINEKNKNIDKILIFAADKNEKLIVFNSADKKIYESTHSVNEIKIINELAGSFDEYIENLVGIKILNESFIFDI